MNSEQVAALDSPGMPSARVEVQSEDDTHFATLVVVGRVRGAAAAATAPAGLPRARRDKMGGEIHALSIRALTPAELAAGN
jgi:acid stress-induced BolA-like protein IbaG/YrbA